MKKIFKYILPVFIAIAIIVFLEPLVNKKKNMKQYDFEVTSIDGVIQKDDFKGKVLALYFGYMYCPDVCPTSLSTLAFALEGFTLKQLEEFRGLFISVDPKRDGLKELDEYSKYFHKNFLGATSDKENIDDITMRYGSFYENVYLEGSQMEYSVSHTSYIYIFNKNGEMIKKVDHFTNPEELKTVLSKLL